MTSFSAFRIRNDAQGYRAGLEQMSLHELPAGEVLVRCLFSGVNYKDALAGAGRAPIVRRFPIIGGIDAAGEVLESSDPRFQPGDLVLATGFGLGVSHDGGYAGYLRLPADWLVAMPADLTPRMAMLLGTAGLTAALAIERLHQQGLQPGHGPVLVTGASGGVGSIALLLLAQAGHETLALTARPEQGERLRALGATEVLSPAQLGLSDKPLDRGRWAAVVDTLGGPVLSGLLGQMRPNGQVAAIGQAMGTELHASLMPFLLRGVGLLGIDSVNIPLPQRQRLWTQMAQAIGPAAVPLLLSRTIGLHGLPQAFADLLEHRNHGRILVQIGRC
jgi:NADPH2:quinone reductase